MNSASPVWRIKRIACAALATALAFSLVACGSLGSGPKEEETRVLRIGMLYGDPYQSDYIRTQYTDLFEFQNKHIDIEVVYAIDYGRYARYQSEGPQKEPDPREEMKKLLEGDNPPDVVIVNYEDLPYFVEENLLASLEPYIEEDKFDIDGLAPSVVNALRNAGNGALYALAPQFSSMALIYNKSIFDKKAVDYPTDNMTWEDMFSLARRVASTDGEQKTFGFMFQTHKYSDIHNEMQLYTAALPLRMFDDSGERLLVDSEAWRNALQPVLQLYQENVIPDNQDWQEENNGPRPIYGPFDYDAFLGGKVAMALIYYSQLKEVINVMENAGNIEGFESFEWDVVTMPVHPEFPDTGSYISMYPLMAINGKAANASDAWELIKFINGKDWAELKSRSSSELLSRLDYIKPINGVEYNIGAFTRLSPPMPKPDLMLYRSTPNIIWRLQDIGRMKLERVVRGELGLDQALKEWQTEGDALLKQFKENPDSAYPKEIEILRKAAGETVVEVAE